jgi:hypothetical protein
MKPSFRAIVILLSLAMLSSSVDVANAGPFRNFFRAIRSAIAHPQERSRHHRNGRSSYKHSETPSGDASNIETSNSAAPAPGRPGVRSAKAASGTNQQQSDLMYGTPVPGKPGFVTSPFAPDKGYVDVTGFPPGTQVEDPYTGKTFLTP